MIGAVQPYLVLCLLLCWVVVFLVLLKGVKSIGKVRMPYVVSGPQDQKFH